MYKKRRRKASVVKEEKQETEIKHATQVQRMQYDRISNYENGKTTTEGEIKNNPG